MINIFTATKLLEYVVKWVEMKLKLVSEERDIFDKKQIALAIRNFTFE